MLGEEVQRTAAAWPRTQRASGRLRWLEGPRGRCRDGSTSWLPKTWQREGNVVDLVKLIPFLLEREVYVCGPPEWMDAVERAALRAGLPKDQRHLERFDW